MNLHDRITEYFQSAKVMQVATLHGDQPWVCSVSYSVDESWNLYWMSLKSCRHSRELLDHSKVAGAVVRDPEVKQGIQFEGIAEEVTGDELVRANDIYSMRYGEKPERLEEARSGAENLRTYYVIKLTKVVLFDVVNFPQDPRQEYVVTR